MIENTMASTPQSTQPEVTSTQLHAEVKKWKLVALMAVGLCVVVLMGVGAYAMSMQQTTAPGIYTEPTPTPVGIGEVPPAQACTMEAKICPDGSSVGRSGPNCAFAECPRSGTETVEQTKKLTYTNTSYGYSISYPEGWKVTTENYDVAANSKSKAVYIFNPEDNPKGSFYSGMKIEYVDVGLTNELPESNGFQNINGADMVSTESPHGIIYYALLPGTDQFLKISGAGGNTANEATNIGLKEAFSTFKFKSY